MGSTGAGGACIGAEASGLGGVEGGVGTGVVVGAAACGTSTGAAGGGVEVAT